MKILHTLSAARSMRGVGIEKLYNAYLKHHLQFAFCKPSLQMGANISRFKKLFSPLNIKRGLVVSLADKQSPLSSEITAITFDDYIEKISEEA